MVSARAGAPSNRQKEGPVYRGRVTFMLARPSLPRPSLPTTRPRVRPDLTQSRILLVKFQIIFYYGVEFLQVGSSKVDTFYLFISKLKT